jgi:hypothetical protein
MVEFRPQSEFPLLEEYRKHFSITPRTIFAYDEAIYANEGLPQHLIVHEQVHLRQQKKHGLDEWVKQYLTNTAFRLRMEVEAYKAQLASIKDREFRNHIKIESALTLSSSLYGNIVSKQEAMRLLS